MPIRMTDMEYSDISDSYMIKPSIHKETILRIGTALMYLESSTDCAAAGLVEKYWKMKTYDPTSVKYLSHKIYVIRNLQEKSLSGHRL
jgi:hypothetical protein